MAKKMNMKGEGYLTHGVNEGGRGSHDLGNMPMPGAHPSMLHGDHINMQDHVVPTKLHNGRGEDDCY